MRDVIRAMAVALVSVLALFGLVILSMDLDTMFSAVLLGVIIVGIASIAISYRVFREKL
jgi:hypothetical protein